MQMELQCCDLQERYRTRMLYAITEAEQAAAAAELADAAGLSQEWAELCTAAQAVDVQLEGVKRKFSQTTRQQVGGGTGRAGTPLDAFLLRPSELGDMIKFRGDSSAHVQVCILNAGRTAST
eukprot:GHRQ01016104.1.p2 GENE.GHRQ01016104.1~~GHRQ01016104.1.p2  ORF type:complete len:122 (-),score=41.75 GHRQ01016104.1:877-1242(-)